MDVLVFHFTLQCMRTPSKYYKVQNYLNIHFLSNTHFILDNWNISRFLILWFFLCHWGHVQLPAGSQKGAGKKAGLRRWVFSSLPWQLDNESRKMRGKPVSGKAIFVLCFACFLAGSLFTSRTWTQPSSTREAHFPIIPNHVNHRLETVTQDCERKRVSLILDIVHFPSMVHSAVLFVRCNILMCLYSF